ncbi:sulfotransferase family 2 domain-containing protein [Sulfurovum sp.]|uniref:sulfotransferase family 2 domain-containing protein n=1 Tax=Sulfurovum sp. TaxID=1969726 RepID=UPI00286825FE|nr:sulfotransferase family 2 domain-containing protein [Sulfurovum sp.]
MIKMNKTTKKKIKKAAKKVIEKIVPEIILDIRKKLRNDYPYRKYTKEHKCIFIHIPKTAGTSIWRVLLKNKTKRDHIPYSAFLSADPEKFNSYYKFTFVRNPWDRLVSGYEYLLQGGNKTGDLYFQDLFMKKYDTFDKFVLNYLDKDKIHEHGLFGPQYLYIYDYKGKCQVDFVGRFENIEQDFLKVVKHLNINDKLPHTNKSKRNDYTSYYTNKEVLNKVSDLYKKDIELFNYTFDDYNDDVSPSS